MIRSLPTAVLLPAVLLVTEAFADKPFEFAEQEPYRVEAAEMEMVKTSEGGVTFLRGGVVVTHGQTVATAAEGMIYEDRDEAVLKGEVKIVEGPTTITAEEASYSRTERLAVLRRGVKVLDGTQKIEADTIAYDRTTRVAVATGSIRVTDTNEKVVVYGDEGSYDFTKNYGIIYRSPHLISFGKRDTISISSDTMELFREEGRSVARGHVLISQGSLEGRCERATHFREGEKVVLIGEPRVDQKGDWLTGDTIELLFEEGSLISVAVSNGGKGLHHPASGESNRIEGNTITVSFREGEVERIAVEGGAKGTYEFREEERTGRREPRAEN